MDSINYKPPNQQPQQFPPPPSPRKSNSRLGCIVALGVLVVTLICVAAGIFLVLRIFGNSNINVFNPSATSTPTTTAFIFPTATPGPISIGDTFQMRVIDVGQGDSILLITPNGLTMLIDGGERNSGSLDYLRANKIDHINIMVATHPDADHIGGLVDILDSNITIDQVVTSGYTSTTRTYERFLDAIIASKAKYTEVHRGDTITLDGLNFAVLSPGTADNFEDVNNGSVVLRVVFGPTSFLLTGDAEKEAEQAMLAAGVPLQATILKVGHHGSSTSTTPAFIAKVKPQVAIYSAGLDNRYGHPHRETIAALNKIGAKIYGTEKNGTIIVTADSKGYKITTTK
jgi:competence protein ComEC